MAFREMHPKLYCLNGLFITKETFWKFSAKSKQLFLEEIFRKQQNTIKFCRPIDFFLDEFVEKLKTLK